MEVQPVRISIEQDWNSALREKDSSCWTTLMSANQPKVYGKLTCVAKDQNESIIEGSNGFAAKMVGRSQIAVTYTNPSSRLSTTSTFMAPNCPLSQPHQGNKMKSIASMDVSLDGLGISCDAGAKVYIWESSSGTVRRQLQGHAGDVYSCRLFPSGIVALTGGADTRVMVWDAVSGQLAATLSGLHQAGITDTCVVEKGRNIVSTSRDGVACLWDVGMQTVLASYRPSFGIINSCSLQPVTNSFEIDGNDEVSDREISTSGKLLLLACENNHLVGFSLKSRKQLFALPCDSPVNTCIGLNEYSALVGCQNGQVRVFDLRNYSKAAKVWQESRSRILSLTQCYGKSSIVISSGDGSCFLRSIKQLQGISNDNVETLELTGADSDPIYCTSYDAKADRIFTGCRDGLIRCYQL